MVKFSTKKLLKNTLLTLCLVLMISVVVFACVSCDKKQSRRRYDGSNNTINTTPFTTSYKSSTQVGYYAKVLGPAQRKIPQYYQDEENFDTYPVYGTAYKFNGTAEEIEAAKNLLIAENKELCTRDTLNGQGYYDIIDSEGKLWILDGDQRVPYTRQNGEQWVLYKHTASKGMYFGDVSDNEPAVIKTFTFSPRRYAPGYSGYNVTGLYAPAGEVIEVRISAKDMEATGGIQVHIGQALYNGQANNIWPAKDFPRMPVVLNTITINKSTATLQDGSYVAYIGSFLGGPIYVRNENVTFSTVISGAVEYSHYILGFTTEEDFNRTKNSSAPYFDLEVWDNGVLHSGSKKYAAAFDYEDLTKAAIYWDKVSLVSSQITSQGIVFLYDPFVAAGAAVAFPGRNSCNCPSDWMVGSLNYEGIVNTGAWGNMHEYNHNFQSAWGRGEGTEVTNNAVNLIEYSLFTNISANRQIGSYGAQGLSDWNRYTTATFAINQAINPTIRENDLSQYAALIHSFGQDMFIKAIKKQQYSGWGVNPSAWCRAFSETTGYDMTYYMKDLVGYEISAETEQIIKDNKYPVFVPIASAYQIGRSYIANGQKQYIQTMRPYQIEQGQPFTIDLRRYATEGGQHTIGSIILPKDINYTIVGVNQIQNGSLEETDVDNVYIYTPSSSQFSDKIIFTLELSGPAKLGQLQNVDIVLQFEQTRDLDKNILHRTVYEYSDDTMYTSATDAFDQQYSGSTSISYDGDNINPDRLNNEGQVVGIVEDSKSDVWFTTDPGKNKVIEISGKLYIDETAKYRIAIRGRYDVAFYYSVNSDKLEDYKLGGHYVQTSTSSPYFPLTEDTYVDITLNEGDWVYFKEVMLVTKYNSFVGLGFGKFTPEAPVFGTGAKQNEIVDVIPESVKVNYASNVYATDYEFPPIKYSSNYFYTRDYTYTHSVSKNVGENQTINYINTHFNKGDTVNGVTYDIENLVDGNPKTNIITKDFVSPDNPVWITIDLQSVKTFNRVVLHGYSATNVNDDYIAMPSNFELSGSTNGYDFTLIQKFEGKGVADHPNRTMQLDIPRTSTRFVKLYVSLSDTGRYFALNSIEFLDVDEVEGVAQLINPSDNMFSYVGDWALTQAPSNFGMVYKAGRGATLEFDIQCSKFGILSSASYGKDFTVYIDGTMARSVNFNNNDTDTILTYLSNQLSSGYHHVKIVSAGEFNIDSLAVWE